MLNHDELHELRNAKAKVFGSDGKKVGTLGQIYLDDQPGTPGFATVHTGLFGMAENFVPLNDAEISGGELYVKFSKDEVKDAPSIDPDGDLSAEDEERLYRYYSLTESELCGSESAPEPQWSDDAPAPAAPLVLGDRMVSEDLLSGRPRLRKYVNPDQGPRNPK
ncbi:PRC-barrel domain-containing protein [Paeniglutamicibacter sp. NPDC091659]|uniref:PRC-barrel domain-containing protein n=1 Tax=Paeniglutamicibacter sp. NPDC091659 TaxID=3364389 RepID=UPI0038103301